MSGTAMELLGLLRERVDRSDSDLIAVDGPDESGFRVEIPNRGPSPIGELVVSMNRESDVDMEVHVPERPDSPFTQHFPWSSDPELLPAIATFVSDFIEEAIVLAHRPGSWRGGRAFVDPERLDGPGRDHFEWAVSWKGTYRLP